MASWDGGKISFPLRTTKRHAPIPSTVASDNARFRFAWKLATPHDRNRDATSQTKLPVFEPESVGGVFQRRKRYFATVKLRKAFGWLFERLLVRRVPLTNGLLLHNLRAFTKPVVLCAKGREFLRHSAVSWRLVLDTFLEHFVRGVAGFNALVPNIAGAVPFENQSGFGNLAGSKSKRVSDSSLILAHGTKLHLSFDRSTLTRKAAVNGGVSTHKL